MKGCQTRMGRKPKSQSDSNYFLTKENLIKSGVATLTEKGFSSVGLDEILSKIGVPKGSFNYYFKNKEEFVMEIIKRYNERFSNKLDFYLLDDDRTSKEGLVAFMEDAKNYIVKHNYKRGCLIGNLGQELNTLPPNISFEVVRVFKNWENKVAKCLEKAYVSGELRPNSEISFMANVFWSGWEGAVLKARLERNVQPLNNFEHFFIKSVFPE